MTDPGRYPLLSSVQEAMWGPARMRFVFEPEPPVPELVSNVRCACFSGDTLILIEDAGVRAQRVPRRVARAGGGVDPCP